MAIPGNTIILLLLIISIIGLGIFIQVKLSRSENKFLGLILPIISFLFSLMSVIGFAAFTLVTLSVGGASYLGIFIMFLMTNIPTGILGSIYLTERSKIKTNKSVEKMKIEDL